ncbi:MAG: protein kinase [Prochloraceae cyanobacterium]|nr:protein kinase [Prochloraceae cyanobacterium]
MDTLKDGDIITDKEGYDYKIIKQLGSGGFGDTYLVESRERVPNQKLVLKRINDTNGSKTLAEEALLEELNKIKRIENDYIVKVKKIIKIQEGEKYWSLILEYIEGENLEQYVERKGYLSENEALKYIKQVGIGLNYLHTDENIEPNIIHHDIKPNNIMLRKDKDSIVIIDFGCSKFSKQKQDLKKKPGSCYAPLTQEDKPSTDVYSLAATLYFLLTGEDPIAAELRQSDLKQLKTPIELNSKISKQVNDAILKGMELKTKDRPETIQEWLELLESSAKESRGYIFTSDEKYSFITNTNKQKNTYYFVLDENNQPIELGNGNYGIVYLVHEGGESKSPTQYAFKILYKYEAIIPKPMSQFISECDKEIININNYDFELNNELKEFSSSFGNKGKEIFNSYRNKLQKSVNQIKKHFNLFQNEMKTNNEVITERYEAEIKSSQDILNEIKNNIDHIPGIVTTKEGTNQFLDSNAYNNLKILQQIDRLSNYGLVMVLYENTLEDLLENGIGKYEIPSFKLINKENEEKKSFNSTDEAKEYIRKYAEENKREELERQIRELDGYDLLRYYNFYERIGIILPYLEHITIGLRYLHKAGYLHLDIKPANIFNRQLDETLQSAIGDLGFLNKNQLKPQSLLGKYNRLALGTLHYRSPEQKYFFDTANVEIVNNGSDIRLIIKIPTFKNTIIEKGDYVIFSKYNDKAYEIERISIEKEKKSPVSIYLKSSETQDIYLKSCKQTQAKFYKIQGKRTDLFGIGAIGFHLITCGESPEDFYESIRKYDTQNSTVDELIDKYKSVYNFETNEPGLIKIFEPFKDQNRLEYVPISIVKLILKCMLYKAKDTFYNENKLKTDNEPTNSLLKELRSLHRY